MGGGNDRWETTLELIVETYNATMDGLHPNLIDTTQTAIRVKAENGASSLTIDGNYMLSEVDTLDDRDGNNTTKYTFKGEKDASDNTGQVILVAASPSSL
jgi:hypothetical protein